MKHFYGFRQDVETPCDRLLIMGRRGTGKSTGVKVWLSEGHTAVYVTTTQKHAVNFANSFVHPTVSNILPSVEVCEEREFKFGRGVFKVICWSDILNIRDTGLSVANTVPEVIIHDEAIRVDSRYRTNAPELLDDLAGTLGRSGKPPKIVLIGNPINNINPYSTHWRVNVLVEGSYTNNGKTSVVVGTAKCDDCFGKKVGVDAAAQSPWCKHLNSGGSVVKVNGRGLRLRSVSGWLYVGTAPPEGEAFVVNNRYTARFYTPSGTDFVYKARQAFYDNKVLFDSFEAELDFYLLTNVK